MDGTSLEREREGERVVITDLQSRSSKGTEERMRTDEPREEMGEEWREAKAHPGREREGKA